MAVGRAGRSVTQGRCAAGLPILGHDMQNPTASVASDPVRELHRRLTPLMLRDQRRFQRRLDGIRKMRDAACQQAALREITAYGPGRAAARARRAAVPGITYPADCRSASGATRSPRRSATTRS